MAHSGRNEVGQLLSSPWKRLYGVGVRRRIIVMLSISYLRLHVNLMIFGTFGTFGRDRVLVSSRPRVLASRGSARELASGPFEKRPLRPRRGSGPRVLVQLFMHYSTVNLHVNEKVYYR